MSWRFTIINNKTFVETVIDEPVGWDKNRLKISRDLEWHGIFFSNQGSTFLYYGPAERVLKLEYEQWGIQADMTLFIEEDCGQGFVEFERSKFVFNDYDHLCSDQCYVKIPLEEMEDVLIIRNRWDQKVNLETAVAFDESTALAPYTALPATILLPSKGIFIQDEFQNENEFETPVQGVPENNNPGSTPTDNNSEFGMIEIGWDNNISSEIGNASSLLQSIYTCVLTSAGNLGCASFDRFTQAATIANEICPLQTTPHVNFQEGSPNYDAVDNPCNLQLQISGFIEITGVSVLMNSIFYNLMLLPAGRVGNVESDYIYLQQIQIYEALGVFKTFGDIIDISVAYSNPNFTLTKGDRIYGFYSLYHARQNADITGGSPAFKMNFQAGNFFKLTNISHTPASFSKVFAINESISRVVESITNDEVRGYSEYFGRTDSQPYSVPADGCGSLEAITDGLRIRRQENKVPGSTFPFAVSLKDLFNGLCPIHNIGMSIEPDPERTGKNRLRVEPWRHFYNDNVILYCRDIKTIRKKIFSKDIFSSFDFGYGKWEAEQYNGLDEFLTKRSYRTTLDELNNTLTKYSIFIASGYAAEITRRLGNKDTKDWRYDKDTFIFCLTRVRKYHVFFDAAGNKMTFQTDTDGSEFSGPLTITISGSLYNNGTRTIFVAGVIFVPGQPITVEIGFSGGATIDEESYNVTFDIVSPAGLFIELGNVINDLNIIEPATIYNYRISPLRNAMRWLNKVLMAYRKFDANAKLLFTDGNGNYFAAGELESLACKLENGTITENMTLTPVMFDDIDQARPFLLAERVEFEYPMLSCDYKAIKANPGGKIYFENDCEAGHGWIDNIIYRPEEQMANFSLIPAAPADSCFPVGLSPITDLPNGTIGVPYSYSFYLTGEAPFAINVITKPSWMTIGLVDNIITLSGTPDASGADISVAIDISNCTGTNVINFADAFTIFEAPGDIEFTCAGGSIDAIPFGVAGTYNWDMNITTITPGPVHIIARNDQTGSLSGYAIYFEADITIAPGQTSVTVPLQYDGGGINVLNNLIISTTDSSGTSGCSDFLFSYS